MHPFSSSISPDFLLHQAPIGILHLGLEGGISSANPVFCKLTGYTETQLRHLDNRAISHPEDFAIEMRMLHQMMEETLHHYTIQKRYRCCDGTFVWTEVKVCLVENGETGEGRLLAFVTDLSDRRLAEQEIHQRRERETLLNDISAQIRSTLDLQTILRVAVQRLRQALETDRVLAYQLFPDNSGICLAEDVSAPYPAMLGLTLPSECIPPAYLDAYRQGRLWSTPDVHNAQLADCYQGMLTQFRVRGMIASAIVSMDDALEPQHRTLWGLLVAHHCRGPRSWTQDEQQLVRAVANQIAMALEQTRLLHQLQLYTHELEERVNQRTQSLQRSLQFEQLIRSLTETMRKDLDEDQMLKAAVQGLVNTLNLDGCISSLFNASTSCLEVRYEFFKEAIHPWQPLINQSFPLTDWSEECCQHLLNRKTYMAQVPIAPPAAQQHIDPTLERFSETLSAGQPLSQILTTVMSPIIDDQGLIGVLTIFQLQPRQFEPDEINLIEQVASQCAIALRQAHLSRQEHEQRLSAEYFRSFLDKSTDIFVEYDSQLRYISINPAGCALLGLPAAAIIGKTNRELLGSFADELDPLIQQAFDTREKVFVDHEMTFPHSGVRVFETTYAPITSRSGMVQRVIGVWRDVTEFKHQWQLLETRNHQLAETTRLKEEFVATTSHELRTPLTAILGFSNVLLQEFFGELNPKQKDYLERIHASGQHLLDLINDILDLSRLEADRLELDLQTIFVPDVCEGVIGLIQERAVNQGLEVRVDIDPRVDWMVADPRRLKQMLLNLLTNAVKFTPAGSIGLTVYTQPLLTTSRNTAGSIDSSHRFPASPLSGVIHFQVWDTGIGITEDDQQRLFAPFSQIDSSLSRKHQGTGLGLVITRKLAELHGGTVQLESTPDQGTRFTISLPLRAGN
ncbi:PAS domain S-box protein [Leptothermofonsia sichuanensis E412]|uniref:ATP-binding protein n=1 Tax=Leptothermofonsia sichuanensis TaxID=2917832 RepID=UPI001CA74769|nr:ATP-binding protein [Leptothermofonsia sichuanensis]QZZ20090.1 PAS domain S-box protein [Leptothermofonsia sichuanensis E412]